MSKDLGLLAIKTQPENVDKPAPSRKPTVRKRAALAIANAVPHAPTGWTRDQSVRGKAYAQVCSSIPFDELREIDACARLMRMSRSALFRAAVRAFVERAKIAGVARIGGVS